MNSDQAQKLKKIFSETFGISDVPDDLSQKNCTKWDSIAHLNLIIAIEAEFGVTFEPEGIASMRDFPTVVAVLDAKLAA